MEELNMQLCYIIHLITNSIDFNYVMIYIYIIFRWLDLGGYIFRSLPPDDCCLMRNVIHTQTRNEMMHIAHCCKYSAGAEFPENV